MAERPSHLRVAAPDERPARKKQPKNISEALDGSSRDVLAAMRKALAEKLDKGEIASNAIASAYKELRELDRLIRLADHEAEESAHSGRAVDDTYDASAV